MVAKHGCLDVSDELLQAAEAFVRKELQGHDASHVGAGWVAGMIC
jgi:hypothetical protein